MYDINDTSSNHYTYLGYTSSYQSVVPPSTSFPTRLILFKLVTPINILHHTTANLKLLKILMEVSS